MRRALAVCSLLPLFFQSAPAFAWGDLGHETVANVAQLRLTQQATAWVESLLGPEPLAVAAIWPDQVRDDVRYKEFGAYHLCDVVNGPTPGSSVLTGDPHNCLSVFRKAPAIISDPRVSRLAKMIALRYLIHVVGDVHQPLHVGNGLDLGANLCTVKIPGPTGLAALNLHSYWDSNVVDGLSARYRAGTKGWFGSKQLAAAILAKRLPTTTPTQLGALFSSQPEQWIAESATLRRTKAYPDAPGSDLSDERKRPYCKFLEKDARGVGQIHAEYFNEAAIPTLTPEQMIAHQDLAEEQIFKAGLRLAAILNTWAAQVPADKSPNPMIEVFQLMANPAVPTPLPPAPLAPVR